MDIAADVAVSIFIWRIGRFRLAEQVVRIEGYTPHIFLFFHPPIKAGNSKNFFI